MKITIAFIFLLSAISFGTAQSTDTSKAEPPIYVMAAVMPEYPGGVQALYQFISQNINYPDSAYKAGIGGKCYLRFVVNPDGYVGKVEVQRGVPGCPACDAEAVRVIKMLDRFSPGINDGTPVHVWFQIPINFSIPEKKKK